jgi:hypothetical protein
MVLLFVSLVLLEVVSIAVYFDLWVVINKQRHIFESLLKLISEKQRKVYQGVYRRSLKRETFCVSDKVDVSGTTFNTVLLMTNFYTLLVNLVGRLWYQMHWHHLLWVNGLVWITYMCYCVAAYRDTRELCFYCKYTIAIECLHFVLLCCLNEGGIPWYLLLIMGVVIGLVLMSTQAARMDRKYAAKQK